MKFENLKLDSTCECSKGLKEDLENYFSRRIPSDKVDDHCFISFWERDVRPKDLNLCVEVCKHKGVSIHHAADRNAVQAFYRQQISTTQSFKRKYVPDTHFCVFKFKKGAGVLKHTPSKATNLHYTFFKSDEFSYEYLDLQEVRKIL